MLKAFVLILIFSMIVACSVGLKLHLDVKDAQKDLESARARLEGEKEELESLTASLAFAKERLQTTKRQVGTHEALTKTKKELAEKIPGLEAEKKSLTAQFLSVVESVRAEAVGQPWKDITLPNGQVLSGVTIKKLTDTELTVTHNGGLAKISLADLPHELKQRFRFGTTPAPVPSSSTPGVANASGSAPSAVDALKQRMDANSALNTKILGMQERQRALEATKLTWTEAAMRHRNLASQAKNRGRPTYTHVANAAAAEQQASIVDVQINKIIAEIKAAQLNVRMN